MPSETLAALHRPFPFRWRQDLQVWPHRFQEQTYWIIHDPLSLSYFRMRPEELAVLKMVDGSASLEELCARYDRDHAPERLTPADLLKFLCQAIRSSLLTSDMPGAARCLAARRRQRRLELRWIIAPTPWVIPLQSFDPRPILRLVTPLMGPLLSGAGAVGLVLLGAAAGMTLWSDPPRAADGLRQALWHLPWIWLAAAAWLVVLTQQLAAAVLLERYSGECRMLRLTLRYLVPMVTILDTDLWQLPGRWKRVAIDGVGLLVGLGIAAGAFVAWRLAPPGWGRDFALALWVVALLLLVLHEANPLSGANGADLLSDLAEQPNLNTRGTRALQFFWHRLLGFETAETKQPPRWIPLFVLASAAWKWLLASLVLRWLALRFVHEPADAALLVVALLAFVRLVVLPGWRLWQLYWVHGRMGEVHPARLVFAALCLCGLLLPALAGAWHLGGG